MLERVIAGGQTGADQAGWRAAKAAGIATGGWMPMGFRTEGAVLEDGTVGPDESHPEFVELYGARSHESLEYRVRTRENVREADALAWFGDPDSRDGRLTLGLARLLHKPAFIVEIGGDGRPTYPPAQLANQLSHAGARTLLIAGNRESKAPGIGAWVEKYLIEVFSLLERGGG
jgi:Circularly permutated YpsA SLOG family